MEDEFTFGKRDAGPGGLLEHMRKTCEDAGFACRVEVTTMTRHKFELHTLIATPPKKLRPIVFTRGCVV